VEFYDQRLQVVHGHPRSLGLTSQSSELRNVDGEEVIEERTFILLQLPCRWPVIHSLAVISLGRSVTVRRLLPLRGHSGALAQPSVPSIDPDVLA
jgi:hypothetical protein